jgi:iron complex outermembrane receptor protein
MKKNLLFVSVVASMAVADVYKIEQVNIASHTEENTKPLDLSGNYIDNSKSINNEVIESLSIGKTNYNEALKLMPSVSVDTLDSYGLTVDQNSIRVRGQFGDTFSKMSNTIGGVPFSISAGVGANGFLVDMNNIVSVDFFAGASAPSMGLGFGNTAGSMNMNIKSPKENTGFEFEQAVGSDSFYKTFGRFDSGKINNMLGIFGSGSIASHDKWTGAGEVNRKNINAMLEIDISENTTMSIFGAFNRFKRHEYKGLTYAETKDLKNNYKNDYNTNLLGTAAVDKYYYDFNKQEMDEYLTFINLTTKINETLLSFKPYYFGNDGKRRIGNPMGFLEMDVAQDAYGSVIEINQPLAGGLLNTGWWYQKADTSQPPASQKLYKIDYTTETAFFAQNFMLTESGYTISNSPFLSYEKEIDDVHVLVGGRYLDFSFPSVSGTNLQNKEMHVDAKHEKIFLPSFLLTYDVTDSIELRSSYHKAYANPRLGTTWQAFASNMTKFQAKNITLQQLWDGLKLEIADNYEIGLMYKNDIWYVASNLYYADVKNKQVAFTDNSDSSNVVSYYLSNASAESKGVEIESGISYDALDLYTSVYYNNYEFKNNINSASNITLHSQGNQIPNTPAFGAKLGAIYNIGDFRIMPTIQYMGKRYGDVEHKEQVDAYTTLDLGVNYKKENVYNNMNLQVTLDVQNIFDEKYIGNINNSLDDSKDGSTTYYQGAPLSAMLSLKLSY